MKRLFIVVLILLSFTGCTVVDFNNMDIDQTINSVLSKNIVLNNKNYEGYKLYIPRGLGIIEKNDYNLQILYEDNTFYLYVDIVGFYYKKSMNYTVNNDKLNMMLGLLGVTDD